MGFRDDAESAFPADSEYGLKTQKSKVNSSHSSPAYAGLNEVLAASKVEGAEGF
jgi:hypothetical protein